MVTLRNAPAVPTPGVTFPAGASEGNSRLLIGKLSVLTLGHKTPRKINSPEPVVSLGGGGGPCSQAAPRPPGSEGRASGSPRLAEHPSSLRSSPVRSRYTNSFQEATTPSPIKSSCFISD